MAHFAPTESDRTEALLAARYLADRDVDRSAIYTTLVDDLGVLPHTALSIIAVAA